MTVFEPRAHAGPLLGAALLVAAWPAQAQSLPPFEINPERVHYQSVQRCRRADSYIVPSFYLHVAVLHRAPPQGRSARQGPRIHVTGLDKQQLQALAGALLDDFVARLRAGGAKVLTFEDIRADAAAFARKRGDGALGLPVRSEPGSATDFVVAAPSDEQAIDWERGAVTRPWRQLARDRFAAVIVPEVTFTLPRIGAKARKEAVVGWLAKEAKVDVEPAMVFSSGMMNGLPQDLRWCNIHVQEHTFRLAADVAGRVEKAGRGGQGGRGDYALIADPQALRTGVLRVGYAFNALMVDALKGE